MKLPRPHIPKVWLGDSGQLIVSEGRIQGSV